MLAVLKQLISPNNYSVLIMLLNNIHSKQCHPFIICAANEDALVSGEQHHQLSSCPLDVVSPDIPNVPCELSLKA